MEVTLVCLMFDIVKETLGTPWFSVSPEYLYIFTLVIG